MSADWRTYFVFGGIVNVLLKQGHKAETLKFRSMRIKGADGHEYDVTGQGQGTYNTVAGSAGLASFLGFNANNLLGGNNRGGAVEVITSDDKPISRYEASMMDKMAAKDAEIALLKSNTYTDQKLADVYERLSVRITGVEKAQNELNMAQAVYNGTNTAAIECLKSQIATLQGLTEVVVPQRRVCDTGCCNC